MKPKLKVHPLKAWRCGQNLTQLELACKLGYASQSIIRGIESWQLDPRASEIAKLCELSQYSLNLWDFVKGNQKVPEPE